MQKSETRVQITTKISEVKTKTAGGQPMYFEDRRRLCETFRRFPNTVRSLPKTTEDHTKPSEDFRRSPEHFRMFSKITRTLSKFSEDCPNTSEDRPNTFDNLRTLPTISGDLRRSPDIFEAFQCQFTLPSLVRCMSRDETWNKTHFEG